MEKIKVTMEMLQDEKFFDTIDIVEEMIGFQNAYEVAGKIVQDNLIDYDGILVKTPYYDVNTCFYCYDALTNCDLSEINTAAGRVAFYDMIIGHMEDMWWETPFHGNISYNLIDWLVQRIEDIAFTHNDPRYKLSDAITHAVTTLNIGGDVTVDALTLQNAADKLIGIIDEFKKLEQKQELKSTQLNFAKRN